MAKKDSTEKAKGTAKKGASRNELIAMGPKGIVKLIVLTAVKLASRNDFVGVDGFGHKGAAVKDKKARKAAANKIQPKFSPKGSLFNLSEDSDTFKELKAKAKSAAPDIEKKNYSASVKALLEYASTHGGDRSFNTEGLGSLL